MSLTIRNLCKSFDDKVIFDQLSYEFNSTGIYALIGDSGAGKTTLLRIIAGLDNGMNFLFDDESSGIVTGHLPYDPLKDERLLSASLKAGDGVQFSHTAEDQIGGQLKAGFTLLDLYEDTNGSGFLHEHGIPSFIATLSKK